jgi:poly(hydroxyalkanoate) depolymerase family esterase
MTEATRLTRSGHLGEATAMLRRLLGRHEGQDQDDASVPPTIDGVAETAGPPAGDNVRRAPWTVARDTPRPGSAQEASAPAPGRGLTGLLQRIIGGGSTEPPIAPAAHGDLAEELVRPSPAPASRPGKFLAGSFSNQAGTRPYKVYVPSGYREGQPVPLIVMLHGCTQSPDDFALGTRMNDAADQHTCIVVYPGQTASANIRKCWNWFNEKDQRRDGGEPSLIAGITREVMRDYSIDPRRVYVAGLSAGGAAAAIMGEAYPDLYAAIGVHSGLACGAARDMASALAAMKRGRGGAAWSEPGSGRGAVPAIVFHGDQDATVNPRNADEVVAQSAHAAALTPRVQEGRIAGGHGYSRAIYSDEQGRTVIEQWSLHGAGHAWSGGSPAGSFTDPRGPDATKEMLRFFLEHPRAEVPVAGTADRPRS